MKKNGDLSLTTPLAAINGKWNFEDNKKQLVYYFDADPINKFIYDIVKLKENEMKWGTTNGTSYKEVTLKTE